MNCTDLFFMNNIIIGEVRFFVTSSAQLAIIQTLLCPILNNEIKHKTPYNCYTYFHFYINTNINNFAASTNTDTNTGLPAHL